VVAHFTLFEYFPNLQARDMGVVSDELAAIELPPEVKIPPPPEQIARPATPRVTAAAVDEDITIAPTTFEENPVESLPPPPDNAAPSDVPSYIERDTEPRLLNPREIERLLVSIYPKSLRDAGLGGRVILWVYIEADGAPGRTQVHTSSGYEPLDEVAEQIVSRMRFSPALLRDRPVGVWIAQPITFSTANQ
jgi:TonB family protein